MLEELWPRIYANKRESVRAKSHQMDIRLGFRGRDAFRQASTVVFSEAVLPFQKICDGLRLNADFNAAQAGQQEIHLPHQAGLAALGLATGLYGHTDFA